MFIISYRNYIVRRADGSSYFIPKDFVGEIPSDVAESNLVKRAIRGGMIAAPNGKKDNQLEKADAVSTEKAQTNDVRLHKKKATGTADEPEDK